MLTFIRATYYYITVAPRVLFAYLVELSNEVHKPLLPQYIEYAPTELTARSETVEDILADASFWAHNS